MTRVAFFTQGTNVPASRFRVDQLVPALRAAHVDCTVLPATPSVYGDTKRFRGKWRALTQPLSIVSRARQLSAITDCDVVWMQRPMTEYFSMPVVPTVLGFDARLQFVHEQDALAALLKATVGPGVGTVNIAGDGVLSVSQAARIAGRATLALPLAVGGWVSQVIRRSGFADFSPEQMQLLAYGRVLDTTRMREVLLFDPAFTTRTAFEDFVHAGRGRAIPLLPALSSVASGTERIVLGAFERLGRAS